MKPILLVAGTRPNFVKVSPLYDKLTKRQNLSVDLIHTGQHYSENMSKVFFDELGLPVPKVNLAVGSGTHAEQTGRVMIEFEKVCISRKPSMIIVLGDVNSTLACSLVGAKQQIKVAHVEAGVRSFDRSMPEEVNRILTDAISDLLFTPGDHADTNLLNEGIDPGKIHRVGNVMIDTLFQQLSRATVPTVKGLDLQHKEYVVVTLHRPSNVDCPEHLKSIIDALIEVSKHIAIVFPVHPRTLLKLQEANYLDKLRARNSIYLMPSLGYLELLGLIKHAKLIVTDSGGIQVEASGLGLPIVTLRDNTEWLETLESNHNVLAGKNTRDIIRCVHQQLARDTERYSPPPLWDGKASDRIADIVAEHCD
jgi:UDP-N-acetylglucosamine 2-epimerase (non-hydrolysing)